MAGGLVEGAGVICKAAMFALGLLVVSQSPAPSDGDWTWLDEHRERAFDALMPIAAAPRQLVAYRRYRDLYQDVPEAHFAIEIAEGPVFGPEKLRAVVTSPTASSIQQQLLQLHKTNRDLSLDALLPRVMIQRQTIVEDRCPSIRSRLNALAKAKIALPDPDIISLHPTVHRFVIETGGVQIDARLTDSNDSLVRWATDTLKAFQGCKPG
jgi:hypothetical protein